jgi:hypothetical protein
MVCQGIVKNGVVILPVDAGIPDGTVVRVETSNSPRQGSDEVLARLSDFAGPTGVPDLALNIDHYLYGHPKVHEK